MSKTDTTPERPDQWYLDALEQKRRTQERLAIIMTVIELIKPLAIIIGGISLTVIAWRMA